MAYAGQGGFPCTFGAFAPLTDEVCGDLPADPF